MRPSEKIDRVLDGVEKTILVCLILAALGVAGLAIWMAVVL